MKNQDNFSLAAILALITITLVACLSSNCQLTINVNLPNPLKKEGSATSKPEKPPDSPQETRK